MKKPLKLISTPVVVPQPDYKVEREDLELLSGDLPKRLIEQLKEEQEIKEYVGFGDQRQQMAVISREVTEEPQQRNGLFDKIQHNANAFATKGDATVVDEDDEDDEDEEDMAEDLVKKREDAAKEGTQSKIANADEDGAVDFDEGGANVATKDTGTSENLYADRGKPLFNSTDDDLDGDDDGPVSRSTVGTEDEMDDATKDLVPKDMQDND